MKSRWVCGFNRLSGAFTPAMRSTTTFGRCDQYAVPANTVPANTVLANTVPANTVPANAGAGQHGASQHGAGQAQES